MRFNFLKIRFEISYLLMCVLAILVIAECFCNFFWCIGAVIIHELGHIVPMCIFGYSPEKIKISMFEISISDNSRQKRSFWQNFFIILFGPFVNFICFISFYLLYLYGKDFYLPIAIANLSVGLFNFMPVLSLDGGQLLYLVLCRKITDTNAERTVDILTVVFIFPMFALGFLLLFNSKYNFSLLFVCVYLVFSLVLKNNRYY